MELSPSPSQSKSIDQLFPDSGNHETAFILATHFKEQEKNKKRYAPSLRTPGYLLLRQRGEISSLTEVFERRIFGDQNPQNHYNSSTLVQRNGANGSFAYRNTLKKSYSSPTNTLSRLYEPKVVSSYGKINVGYGAHRNTYLG